MCSFTSVTKPAGGRLLKPFSQQWRVYTCTHGQVSSAHMPSFTKVHVGQMSTGRFCSSSSWTSCRREGSSCVRFCGVCVLASSNQSQRYHQKIHSFLLQPPSHSKTTKTRPQAQNVFACPVVYCWLITLFVFSQHFNIER